MTYSLTVQRWCVQRRQMQYARMIAVVNGINTSHKQALIGH